MKFILALLFATIHAVKINSAQLEAEKLNLALATTDCPYEDSTPQVVDPPIVDPSTIEVINDAILFRIEQT